MLLHKLSRFNTFRLDTVPYASGSIIETDTIIIFDDTQSISRLSDATFFLTNMMFATQTLTTLVD